MKRNTLLLVLVMACIGFSLAGCRTVPISEPSQLTLSGYGKLTAEDVRGAIVRGGAGIGWQMADEAPGMVTGTWVARTHSVTVEIPYTNDSYAIKYRSSVNMDEKDGMIHSNYNRWVDRLNRHISAELAKLQK